MMIVFAENKHCDYNDIQCGYSDLCVGGRAFLRGFGRIIVTHVNIKKNY